LVVPRSIPITAVLVSMVPVFKSIDILAMAAKVFNLISTN
jgi:hypothetical protein